MEAENSVHFEDKITKSKKGGSKGRSKKTEKEKSGKKPSKRSIL
jgi:hypothetical protein